MQDKKRIPLSVPHMSGAELGYLNNAFATNNITLLGPDVDKFEQEIADYVGKEHAVALYSGTGAIHLGLKYLGVSAGDVVFCSDVTFAASCNPILYEKAEPVFIDSDRESWNMSPRALERALEAYKKKGKLPKCVVIVDLYGLSADYGALLPICEKYGVPVLEDAAEALGTEYRGEKCGSFGHMAALSFNTNKIITCSGGGALLVDSKDAADKIRFWSTQSKEPVPYYLHKETGYNYRMSNVLAGIGRGQMTALDKFVDKRRWINSFYRRALADLPVSFASELPDSRSNFWLSVILLDPGAAVTPAKLISTLTEEDNIETRHFWNPMHLHPLYSRCVFFPDDDSSPAVGEDLFARGVCLPSSASMTEEDLTRVADCIRRFF